MSAGDMPDDFSGYQLTERAMGNDVDRRRSKRTNDWRSRTIVGNQIGAGELPAWCAPSYDIFRNFVTDDSYPCFFGTHAELRGEILYAFVEDDNIDSLVAVMTTFVSISAARPAPKNNLAIFFAPDEKPLSHDEYRAKFWHVLQHLHDHDPCASDDICADPSDTLWEFSFAKTEMFVVCVRPVECKSFFFGFMHVVRLVRVSGLLKRQFTRRGPVWRSADWVQIGVPRSWRSETHWFSRSRLNDRLPLPSDRPAHILDDLECGCFYASTALEA